MTDTNGKIKDLVEQLGQPDTASHVQELLSQAGTLNEVTKTIQAYQNSQTDAMIERLASIMEPLGALANEVAKPEVFSALQDSIAKITELHSSGALDALIQMATFATAAKNSMGDSVIERSAATMEPLGALANEMGKPEVSAALQDSIKTLTELHSNGALDALTQMATFATAGKNSMTDSLVGRLSGMFENLVGRFMNPQIQELFGAMVEGAHDTMAEMKEEPYKQGMLGLLKTARDPEVQKSLQFAMNFAKNFHKSLTSVTGPKL